MEAATLTRAGSAVPPRRLRAAPDERLVARLREGDPRAFEVIYDRYHLPLLSFCRHMVGTREEAEDALQQVFVSAHTQLRRDERPVQLRPWLYAIARNRCLTVLRARRETVAIDDVREPSADGLAVGAQVQQRQDLQDILRDLAQLPDDQRAALVLSELEDLTHEEIAQALDVRRDKVKALVFQARETLMGFRQARDADCIEIREQLATLRGAALRRASLQRHVAICEGCASFKDEVKRQRAALGAVMPVVPALALKHQILGAVHASAAGTGAAGAAVASSGGLAASVGGASGTAAAVGSSSVVVKVLAAAAIAASAGGGAVAIKHAGDGPSARRAPAGHASPVRAAPVAPPSPVIAAPATTTAHGRSAGSHGKPTSSSGKSRGADDRTANGRGAGSSHAGGNDKAAGQGRHGPASAGATGRRGAKSTPAAANARRPAGKNGAPAASRTSPAKPKVTGSARQPRSPASGRRPPVTSRPAGGAAKTSGAGNSSATTPADPVSSPTG